MSLRSFTISSAAIPFRTAFAHASAVRSQAENVLVIAEGRDGVVGVGEGCPRAYVTGETQETARDFLGRHRSALMAIGDLAELREWIGVHASEIDAAPAAFCAAELALLDVFGQRGGASFEALLGVTPAAALAISAVYGASGDLKLALQGAAFGLFGLRDAKLKLSGSREKDRARAVRLARSGRVRLDANNMFASAEEAIAALTPMRDSAWAVEEPVAARDWPALSRIQEATGLSIICDESLLTRGDLHAMPDGFVPNLRVSKLGGLIRALQVLHEAIAQWRPIIVGAQVGETSILARAGVTLASAAGSHLAACEIGYGPWLLRRDVVTPSLGFGWRGMLHLRDLPSRSGAGLRLTGAIGRD